ncbi:MAG: BtaA family protein, partial [Saprospiraceae bacterium]
LAHTIGERVFQRIHGHHLVYNTCWEDPRCDRQLLQLNAQSRVLMLTSAGCNALDYLLDMPAEVHCVDLNPRQNALLQLKLALLQGGDHPALFDLFGTGASPHTREIFQDVVKDRLPDAYTRQYWQRNIRYFNGKGLRSSFYWHGSSGTVAWLIRQWLHRQPDLLRLSRRLLEASSLVEQWVWYEQLEPLLLGRFLRWLVSQHLVQSMLGVPKSQQHLAMDKYPDGMAGYIRQCFRQVFTRLPLTDNYFWKLYFYGRYTPDCCPNYLRAEHFSSLHQHADRVHTHTASLSDLLHQQPGQYTHFVLLDHQDWLAANLRSALEEEWRLILDNAAPGAKVLLRSASFGLDFLPDFARERLAFDREAGAWSQANDRVGTYASTWIGTISN